MKTITTNFSMLFKNIILSPKSLFDEINNNEIKATVYVIFSISAIITFLKALTIQNTGYPLNNFFESGLINQILSFFNKPIVRWAISYLSLFLFIIILSFFLRLFYKIKNLKSMTLCIMSISLIGVVSQIIFMLIKHFTDQKILFFISQFLFVWCLFLTIYAIIHSQKISFIKIIVPFLISAFISFFISGQTGITPYLSWILK